MTTSQSPTLAISTSATITQPIQQIQQQLTMQHPIQIQQIQQMQHPIQI